MFTGQEHDENTDLIYFGARYYDPQTSRFINEDIYLGESTTAPSLHRYLYAYAKPTVYYDPDGHISKLITSVGKRAFGTTAKTTLKLTSKATPRTGLLKVRQV